jgi:hypothetical protein
MADFAWKGRPVSDLSPSEAREAMEFGDRNLTEIWPAAVWVALITRSIEVERG